jgi:WD40 repeat protein
LSPDEQILVHCIDQCFWGFSPAGTEPVQICRLSDGCLLDRFNCSIGVRCLCFSPDRSELFLASYSPNTRIQIEFWNISSLELIRRVELPDAELPRGLFVSPACNVLIVLTGKRIFLLNRKTGTIQNWLEVKESEPISSLAVSPDGNQLAVCMGRTVRLLDARSLRLVEAFDWDLRDLRAVAFSPDGMTMAAAGQHRIVVWDCGP